MAAIEKVNWRKTAKARRAPYWKLYTKGRYIGWRKMTQGPGTWLARSWDGEKPPVRSKRKELGGYHQKALGDFADKPEEERYDAALAEAVKWFHDHLDKGGSPKSGTVREACESYMAKLRAEEGEQAATNAEGFLRRLVYDDPLAKVLLSKLTKSHCSAWRARVLERSETKSSFNRNITPLRATLNLALEDGKVATDQAWLKALKPFPDKDVHNPRTLYLDGAKRHRLVEKASDEARPLFKALNMLPLRPGEVAALRVEHLKAQERALEIPAGKTKVRTIPLTAEALAHFKVCARGKLPAAWLVARADGSQLRKEWWRDEIKAAAKKAKLPRATVAYTLRHSVIADLVTGGLDIFTVAKLSGTSVAMIDKTYGKLLNKHARSALEKLAMG